MIPLYHTVKALAHIPSYCA